MTRQRPKREVMNMGNYAARYIHARGFWCVVITGVEPGPKGDRHVLIECDSKRQAESKAKELNEARYG